jgi:hypothetical protein
MTVGPPCKVTKKELLNALSRNVTLTESRLAFSTFEIVRDKRGFS